MKTMSRITKIMLLGAVVVTFAGCNTVHGFGQDLSAGGKALSASADKVSGKNRNTAASSSGVTMRPVSSN